MDYFLLTIDVEDWFQVENFRPWIPFSTWDSRELRVEANVHKFLDLFDDIKLNAHSSELNGLVNPIGTFSGFDLPSNQTSSPNQIDPAGNVPHLSSKIQTSTKKKIQGTFFVLGWIAKRLPRLVREIATRGHEVASHGLNHQMCNQLTETELRGELGDSKRLLEDITGNEVLGFRAPNFSVNERVLSVLQETGYLYDSSFNSFSIHGRYGKIRFKGKRWGIAYKLSGSFFEIPISNLNLVSLQTLGNFGNVEHFKHFPLPWGGGAYFRLIPLPIFSVGVRFILKKEGAYTFYMHPWEIDLGQPFVRKASIAAQFKHYTKIKGYEDKLKKVIKSFADCCVVTCKDYLINVSRKEKIS